MKKIFLLGLSLHLFILCQAATTINVATPGNLSKSTGYSPGISQLKIKGSIDARDFKTMRDDMQALTDVDLSGATIVGYDGTDGTLSTDETYYANTIPQSAFVSKTTLTSFVFPTETVSIEQEAFSGCKALKIAVLPSKLVKIEMAAFLQCESLSGILNIPASVGKIGDRAFAYCSNLTGLSFESGSALNSIGVSAFSNCSGLSGELVFPEGLKTIGTGAFERCSKLAGITLPTSLTAIGSFAFQSCSGLVSVTVMSKDPLKLTSSIFTDLDYINCTLYVPDGALGAYQNEPRWNDFKNFIEGKNFWLSGVSYTLAKTKGSSATCKVTSNTTCTATVTSGEGWLTVDPSTAQTNSYTLKFTATSDNLDKERNGVVTVKDIDGNFQDINVRQTGKILLSVLTSDVNVTKEKEYDKTTTAKVEIKAWSGKENATDKVDLVADANYENDQAGSGKTISVVFSLTGADKDKYEVPDNITMLGTIKPRTVTVAVNTDKVNKVYDGIDAVNVTGTLIRTDGLTPIMKGDNVTLSISGKYSKINAEANIPINMTPLLVGEASVLANYSLASPDDITGTITQKELTANVIAKDKAYDGTTTATITGGSLTGVVGTEDVQLDISKAIAEFKDASVENGKTVTVSNLALTGAPAVVGNYTLKQPATTTANITGKELKVIDLTLLSKKYDGKTNATVNVNTVIGIAPTDTDVKVKATGIYDTKDHGSNKKVTIHFTVYSASGTGTNYKFYSAPKDSVVNNGIIDQQPLSIAAPTIEDGTNTRDYDGTTKAKVTPGVLTGVAENEVVNVIATANYDTKDAGGNKTVTVSYTIEDENYIAPTNNTTVPNCKINQKTLTVLVTAKDKSYDGNTNATITGATLLGVVDGENIKIDYSSATGVFEDEFVGRKKTVTVVGLSLIGDNSVLKNYTLETSSKATADIIGKVLKVTSLTLTPRKYNGKTDAIVTVNTIEGVANTDLGDVKVRATGTYDNKNVGNTKTVTIQYSVYSPSGGSSYQYYSAPEDSVVGNGVIDQQPLTISAPTIENGTNTREYNGDVNASVTPGKLSGLIDNEVVNVTANATYEDKNFGNKQITVSYTVDDNNYSAPTNDVVNGSITPKTLTVDNAKAQDKNYDGNQNATITGATLTGVVSPDDVKLDPTTITTGKFEFAKAGTWKVTTEMKLLTGGDEKILKNYSLKQPELNATINGIRLALSDPNLETSKTYDGTDTVKVVSFNTDSPIGRKPEHQTTVQVKANAKFNDEKAGTGKIITVKYTLTGNDADGYIAPDDKTITGEITPKQLTIADPELLNNGTKIYDKKTDATVTKGDLSGIINNDIVNVTIKGNYEDEKAGENKKIYVTYSADNTNYAAPTDPKVYIGKILPKELTVENLTANNKPYDGTTGASLTGGTLKGIIEGDKVELNYGACTFEKATADDNYKTKIDSSKMVLTGDDAANYSLTFPSISAFINKKQLTISTLDLTKTKTYDGTTNVIGNINVSPSGIEGIDDGSVGITATAAYNTKSAGDTKTITVQYELTGISAGNYSAPSNSIVTDAVILPAPLTITQNPSITQSRVYNGDTNAEVTSNPLYTGNFEDINLTAIAVFKDKNVGADKPITVTYNLNGNTDYVTPSEYVLLKGEITKKQLSAEPSEITTIKTYDGNRDAATIKTGNVKGVVTIDDANVHIEAKALYITPDAGKDKDINVHYRFTLASTSDTTNYAAPVDSIIHNAKIIDIIVIGNNNTVPTPTAACDGDYIDLQCKPDPSKGTPVSYRVELDQAALAAGLSNTGTQAFDITKEYLQIPVPQNVANGTYQGTLILIDESGTEYRFTFSFTINVSSNLIVKKFDDVVLFDNHDGRFTKYQWFKNGVEIQGATEQFYYDAAKLAGNKYSVKLTTTDNKNVETCIMSFAPSSVKAVSAYPSPVKAKGNCTISITGLNYNDLGNATLDIYSSQGLNIYKSTKVDVLNTIRIEKEGVYIGTLTTSKGEKYQFKVIVAE